MLTASRLRRLISYDRASGVMRWLAPFLAAFALAAWQVRNGQTGVAKIAIDGKSYLSNQLAVLHATGRWPAKNIIHRNGVRSDVRWRNLQFA